MSDQVLTVPEAAERLKLTPRGVTRLIRDGRIRAARIGRGHPGYRILASEVERFVRGEDRKADAGAS